MVQTILLIGIFLLSIVLFLSVIKSPFDKQELDNYIVEYKIGGGLFKITKPKINEEDNKKIISFDIIIKKEYRYLINFPLLFRFFSLSPFKADIIIYYLNKEEKKEILNKTIEYSGGIEEHKLFINDIIVGKLSIEIISEIEYGNPIIEFELCNDLIKNNKFIPKTIIKL